MAKSGTQPKADRREAATDEMDPVSAPVGRPRANPRPIEGSARDEIIAAATRLFSERGFAQTTMAQIAETAGLRQSSLYYYFRRKELILQATFSVNRAPLEFLERIRADAGGPDLRLYRLIRFDAAQLCLAPCDVNEVWRISLVEPDLFTDFWEDRRELHKRVEQLVRQGISDELFVEVDPRLTALTLMATNEGAQNWWRLRDERRLDGRAAGRPPRYSPAEVGEHLASASLRSLLRRPARLPVLQREAERFDD